jgi:S1-C subfamily serine protease
MSPLKDISQAMGAVVEESGTAVIRVDARRRFPASGIVWSNDGLIVTANHVIRRDNKIAVGLADQSKVTAQLIGRDPSTDVALLKVEASDLKPLELATNGDSKVGHLVLALGRPGQSVQATLGVISAVGSPWQGRHGGKAESIIQTDVTMYPGFSGGPLVDTDGKLIGLNTSALIHGISATLPAETLQRVVGSLQEYGRVRRGYLGVSTQVVRLQEEMREQLGQRTGLLIVAVESDSPAAGGGLTIGDTIVKLAGQPIRRHNDLMVMLSQADLEEKTPLEIVRGGELQTLNIHIGERTE